MSLALLALILAFDLTSSCRLLARPVPEVVEDWITHQRLYFFAVPFLCLATALTPFRIYESSAIALLLSIALDWIDFFDSGLHHFLVRTHLYAVLGLERPTGNPQFAILTTYGSAMLALVVALAARGLRSVELWFCMLLAVANLGSVFLLHRALPDGVMRAQFAELNQELSRLPRLPLYLIQEECIAKAWACRLISSAGHVRILNAPAIESEVVRQWLDHARAGSSPEIIETNQAPSIYRRLPLHSGGYLELFAFEQPRKYWSMSAGNLFSLNYFVSLFWFLGITALSVIHRGLKGRNGGTLAPVQD
jgi:hypothetical protein